MRQFIKNWVFAPKLVSLLTSVWKIKKYDSSLFVDEFKDQEKGNRCFIVATGSSIKEQDLSLLQDEIVIGVSGLYNHKYIHIMNPKYYINPPIFTSHSNYYSEEKFIAYLRDMDATLADSTIMFFDIGDRPKIEFYKLFTRKKIIWKNYVRWNQNHIRKINLSTMPSIWSVSESAIQVALYLGFDKIYLLGFDHDWFNGLFNYAYDIKKARKHFTQTAEEVSKKHGIDAEFQMTRHAQIFNKYKKLYNMKKNIYNANADQNSYVDTFPKVRYEDLFKK